MDQAATGWYEDPGGSGGLRYWDGAAWTDRTRPHTADGPAPAGRKRGRWLVLTVAFAAVLAIGLMAGWVVGGGSDRDPVASPPESSPEAVTSEREEPQSALRLVGQIDRPTEIADAVHYVDIGALRAASLAPQPDPSGDGWTTRVDGGLGTIPVWQPYLSVLQLHRTTPMDRVVGLAFDEVSVSMGTFASPAGWFVPTVENDLIRERLHDSPVWSEPSTDAFERVGDFTSAGLGGYEPDTIEQRLLEQQATRAELSDGALKLDAGGLTRRDEALDDDADWAAVLERLAAEQAVSALLMPHDEVQVVRDGVEALQPARALAMAAVIDGGGLSDLVVLEHADGMIAEANAEAARRNLDLLALDGSYQGEVRVDGTTVLIRTQATGDQAGSSELIRTFQRGPTAVGMLTSLIGTADPAAASEPLEQSSGRASLVGAELTVASKDFDEQLILGEISVALLEDAGATVDNRGSLGGTDRTRAALESGEIDHYWEYTGTAWITFFGETQPIPDRIDQYEAVRHREAAEQGLFWLEPTRFNNTYGIAVSPRADAALGGVDTISEMRELLESDPDSVTLCVESEFNIRDDGLSGLEARYGMEIPATNVMVLDGNVIYDAVADSSPCTFGEVFTTDGRIAALNLKVLEDDRAFFPIYSAAPVFTASAWSEYGQVLQHLYAPVTAALDDATMASLNARVSVDGERPAAVARGWLTAQGFID